MVSIAADATSTPPAAMLSVTAAAQNDTSQRGVTWTLSPATGAGTLSDADGTSVTYNAPDNPPASDLAVTITATAVADAAASASTTVTVPAHVTFVAKSVACQPAAATLNASCGTVDVPFDRRHADRGTIPIYFERYAHTGPTLESAIVIGTGGGGASSTAGRDLAWQLFAPNLEAHDLLLIDARGTGNSGALDCPSLQHGTTDWKTGATDCAAQLGPSASFYETADMAKDTEAVRAALGYDKLDYYGFSSGGGIVTAYATRFASHLRSIIIDASIVWPAFDEAQFTSERIYTQSPLATIAQQCSYSATCTADHPDPTAELVALIQSVRATPIEGEFVDAGGAPMHFRIDENDLLTCMMAGVYGYFRTSGELPAAALALAQRDPVPLLRLRAEGYCPAPHDHGDPMQSSAAVGWAKGCIDQHQAFDWTQPVADRISAFNATVAALPSDYFAPFSNNEPTSERFSWADCVYFERPTPVQPMVRPEATFPSTPTLVIDGDIDIGNPTAAVAAGAAKFPNSSFITVADTGHFSAAWSQCARNLITEFITKLRNDSTACAQVPDTVWPAVGRFPLLATGARPADVDAGGVNEIDLGERKVATVAVAAVNDALERVLGGGPAVGVGLRGGTYSVAWGTALTLTLTDCAFTSDVKVSGTVTWTMSTLWSAFFLPSHRPLTADLTVTGPGTAGGSLHVTGNWLSNDPIGSFSVTGTLGGKMVAVLVPEA